MILHFFTILKKHILRYSDEVIMSMKIKQLRCYSIFIIVLMLLSGFQLVDLLLRILMVQ